MKNNSSSNNNLISKYFIIKKQLKIQELIISKLSNDLNSFQIAENELTNQIQILESQNEKRKEIRIQNIYKKVIIIISTTIALKILGTLTLFTFIGAPLLAFVIDDIILNKEDKMDIPDNIEEDLESINLALQYIKKMVNKLNQTIEREQEKTKEIENNKHNEDFLLTENIINKDNNYDTALEQVQKEIWDSTFEEIINEYDVKQNLALSLSLNYKNDD